MNLFHTTAKVPNVSHLPQAHRSRPEQSHQYRIVTHLLFFYTRLPPHIFPILQAIFFPIFWCHCCLHFSLKLLFRFLLFCPFVVIPYFTFFFSFEEEKCWSPMKLLINWDFWTDSEFAGDLSRLKGMVSRDWGQVHWILSDRSEEFRVTEAYF